jgi:FkbM family methyltransferase
MICYAQNFEDVILQRVFADVSDGCFLDVGASTPIGNSNTYALYQKGWRGVAMEPLPYQELWREARPEDVFLNAAVGEKSGSLTLQVYDDTHQISSGVPETVTHWQRNGIQPSRSVEVPMVTLDQVIGEYLSDLPLHLLSIDVEGMEHQVLKGLDLNAHRPWVVVLEATVPGSPVPTHQVWEPLLQEAGYMMSYFDGLNRFYLAQEHRSLQGLFALPPNIWDGFVMASQIEQQAEIARLKAQIAQLQAR